MWDPWSGRVVQFYPATVGGRALNAWNEDGSANIQIEVFFSPGAVRGGKRYDTVADTPCKGLPQILAWLDGFGIPRVWPLGAPQWQGNSRDADVWNTRAGHYGHCNVPDNTHTDPGPMPSLAITNSGGTVRPIPEEDELSAAEVKQIIDAINAQSTDVQKYVGALLVYGYESAGVKHPGIGIVVEENQRRISALPGKVWNQPVTRAGKQVSALQDIANGVTGIARIDATLAGQAEIIRQLTSQQGLDPAKVDSVVQEAVKKALADGTVTVDINVGGPADG
ncbi:hypothetical protein [Arthrobacter woluwensis]|uniref:hypothetical protein n=1 Tax=Arthrobacter woluwensis TaxID=156980 RepID=UPI001AAF7763|nr:hypothetical protein [Arthrobacter woluwensis]QTF71249.1 hypothetical protein G8758_03935 [Arthrobacter woluwensis]